jgi:O-antigen/teichoic acid export membrane protein
LDEVVKRLVRYTFSHAPWALIASLSSGLSNYLVILTLSGVYGLAAGGQFRLFLSIMAMLSIFTLTDTGKIAVKYLVLDQPGVVKPLLLNRARWALLGMVAGLATAAVFRDRGNDLWIAIMAGSLLLPLTYPPDIYAQINQARLQFKVNAIYSVCKYTTLVALALVAVGLNIDVVYFLVAYCVVLTAFHVYFVTRHPETFEPPNPNSAVFVREGMQLSGSGLFPLMLEHADKFLISYFFGLEALGLYTIGVSTGRLLVNFVKPVLSIYFPILVDRRPSTGVLTSCLVGLTAVGLIGAVPMQYYFTHVLGEAFVDGYPLAAVVVAGLGIHAVGVIVYYSSVYYRNSPIAVPTITNIATTLIVMAYLVASAMHGGDYALLLCAASFPLRDFLNMVITSVLSRKIGSYEKAGSVL